MRKNPHDTRSEQEKCPRCRGNFLFNFETGEVKEVYCKAYKCPVCGDWKKYELKKAIDKFVSGWDRVRMWTFTFSSHIFRGLNTEERFKLASKIWKTFRDLLRSTKWIGEKERNFQYLKIIELQKNGSPHFHALVDRYVYQPKLNKIWQTAIKYCTDYKGTLGNANVSKSEENVSKKNAGNYIIKYITKQLEDIQTNFLFRRWSKSGKGSMFAHKEKSGDWLFIHLNSDRYSLTSVIEFAIYQRENVKKPPNQLFSIPPPEPSTKISEFNYGDD